MRATCMAVSSFYRPATWEMLAVPLSKSLRGLALPPNLHLQHLLSNNPKIRKMVKLVGIDVVKSPELAEGFTAYLVRLDLEGL